jgi:hypothetical protein
MRYTPRGEPIARSCHRSNALEHNRRQTLKGLLGPWHGFDHVSGSGQVASLDTLRYTRVAELWSVIPKYVRGDARRNPRRRCGWQNPRREKPMGASSLQRANTMLREPGTPARDVPRNCGATGRVGQFRLSGINVAGNGMWVQSVRRCPDYLAEGERFEGHTTPGALSV